MPKFRPRDWLRCVFVIILLGVVLVAEHRYRGIRDFYVQRPLLAGILSGVLQSIAALFGIDVVRANLRDRRWAPLSRLALISLAYETTLLIDTFLWLATGQAPTNDARPDHQTQQSLLEKRDSEGLPPPPVAPDLGKVQHDEYATAIKRLLGNEDWRQLALAVLDRAKWKNRDGVAVWAAAMLTLGESADVLDRISKL